MTTAADTTPDTADEPQHRPEVDDHRELVDVDPALLLVDRNIREARLDKAFLASVKRHGVLVPIVAVRTPDGLRVRMGNRRTLAAVQTARPTVPVLVNGAEDDDHAARIVAQWTENEHRTALTNAERVEAVHQLSLYGLSAAQIATRTAAPKSTVTAALTVAGNELAAKATIRYDFLTLEQAAILTRFERDTETVTALVAAAKLGPVQFDRVVAEADADAAEMAADQARRDRAAAALAEAGCRVIVQPENGDGTARLSRLLDAATGEDLNPENHATCTGHAAWLEGDWEPVPEGEDDPEADEDGYRPVYVAVYVCTEPHRHRDRWATASRASTSTADVTASGDEADAQAAAAQARAEQQKAEQAAHRREVIANNRSWRQCELAGIGSACCSLERRHRRAWPRSWPRPWPRTPTPTANPRSTPTRATCSPLPTVST